MTRDYNYPFLYDKEFWYFYSNETNMDIGKKFNCPSSTVRYARKKMDIFPLSIKQLKTKQWKSVAFRKKRSEYPQLYDKSFFGRQKT